MSERQPLIESQSGSESERQPGQEAITHSANDRYIVSPKLTNDRQSNAILGAQGHAAEMDRAFSPLAALGLGFR